LVCVPGCAVWGAGGAGAFWVWRGLCELWLLLHRAPGTSRDLPAASTRVSARLGIDGALSMRHLWLWTFLLSTSLLPLSYSLPAPTGAGASSAISASWLVVVKTEWRIARRW